MPVILEWDESKAQANLKKHKLSFELAVPVIMSGRFIAFPDMRREYGETRMIGLGMNRKRLLCVVFTMRPDAIRIISLRKANKREEAKFKEAWGI